MAISLSTSHDLVESTEPRHKPTRDNITNLHPIRTERSFVQHFDPTNGVKWIAFCKTAPTKMTENVILELKQITGAIEDQVKAQIAAGSQQIRYQVLASNIPGVFNLGGDLQYISKMIREKNRKRLVLYGYDCAALVYNNAVSYKLPITTISLVQGTAMGGGLEAALSANVVVAERNCKLGLPEVMFNMFPAMGAYQLLKRRISAVAAERLIQSGKTYSAEELFDMGIVDILADPGEGEQAVWDFVSRHSRQFHAEWGLKRMIQATDPALNLDELYESINIWADTALTLSEQDLQHMEFLIRAQRSRGV